VDPRVTRATLVDEATRVQWFVHVVAQCNDYLCLQHFVRYHAVVSSEACKVYLYFNSSNDFGAAKRR